MKNHPLVNLVNVDVKSFRNMNRFWRQIFDNCYEVITKENVADYMNTQRWIIAGITEECGDSIVVHCEVNERILRFAIPDNYETLTNDDIRFLVYHEFGHFLDCMNGRIIIKNEKLYFDNDVINLTRYFYIQKRIDYFQQSNDLKSFRTESARYSSIPIELSANVYAAIHTTAPQDIGLRISYEIGIKNGKNSKNLSI